MYATKSVSVIIPAYNEEATIGAVVEDFFVHPEVDEVLVVDNNCRDRTAAIAAAAGARVVAESDAGYGRALMRGMRESKGELLALVEADGSFRAHDLSKLLCYLPDCAMVLGTRTTRQMVEQGANMDFFLRWGNVVAAKILELFWYVASEPRLTDVGCTFRALHRKTFEVIAPGLREKGPAFSPEMICEALRHRLRALDVEPRRFRVSGSRTKSTALDWVSRSGLNSRGPSYRLGCRRGKRGVGSLRSRSRLPRLLRREAR